MQKMRKGTWVMFQEPTSLTIIFGTIGIILVCIGIGIMLVNKKTKQLKGMK